MFFRIVATLAFLALSTAASSCVGASRTCVGNFVPRRVVRYKVEQKMQTKMKIGDNDVNQSMAQVDGHVMACAEYFGGR